jgi:carbohydrate-selective porin OprB
VRVNSLLAQGAELYNDEVALPAGLPLQPIPREEDPIEIDYAVKFTAVTLRPSLQFIHAPGGMNGRSNILLFGARVTVQL